MDIIEEFIKQYIDELEWSSDATFYEKHLLRQELQRFCTWLKIKQETTTTISGVI